LLRRIQDAIRQTLGDGMFHGEKGLLHGAYYLNQFTNLFVPNWQTISVRAAETSLLTASHRGREPAYLGAHTVRLRWQCRRYIIEEVPKTTDEETAGKMGTLCAKRKGPLTSEDTVQYNCVVSVTARSERNPTCNLCQLPILGNCLTNRPFHQPPILSNPPL
jgi:hypothetical protein